MASSSSLIISLSLFVCLSLLLPAIYAKEAGVICEDLPSDLCAFSISSSGRRCVLSTTATTTESTSYHCQTSAVVVTNYMADWIETDACIFVCGLDRNTVGMPYEELLEGNLNLDLNLREKLCSMPCRQGCPNIVELFANLGSGEDHCSSTEIAIQGISD